MILSFKLISVYDIFSQLRSQNKAQKSVQIPIDFAINKCYNNKKVQNRGLYGAKKLYTHKNRGRVRNSHRRGHRGRAFYRPCPAPAGSRRRMPTSL